MIAEVRPLSDQLVNGLWHFYVAGGSVPPRPDWPVPVEAGETLQVDPVLAPKAGSIIVVRSRGGYAAFQLHKETPKRFYIQAGVEQTLWWSKSDAELVGVVKARIVPMDAVDRAFTPEVCAATLQRMRQRSAAATAR